ncbi:MoaD/ThiS family protein [Thermodesulfobacteriota bacterium]
MIRVNLYTILGIKDIIGEREVGIEVPDNSSLSGLITEIVNRWGNGISEVLFEPESKKIKAHLRLMVNGQDISFLDGLDTRLKDGDEVMIFPPVSGG